MREADVQVEHGGVAPAFVEGDAFLLRQAIANLIENAAAFAPAHSTIALDIARNGDRIVLTVSDRGPGIPDYALPRVFERFYSLPRFAGGCHKDDLC